MCGLGGIVCGSNSAGFGLTEPLTTMCQSLAHRGPDSHGTWTDLSLGVGLAHSRLAVLDLSELGAQPMTSPSGRYTLAFNGEIYNHKQIRNDFSGENEVQEWKGNSDTETLLALIDRVGPIDALPHTVGMFAIAVWDRDLEQLTVARDRFGEKPLYYGTQNGIFVFGSDLSVFAALPGFDLEIDRESLALYMRFSYVPSPRSIYSDVRKLKAGEYLQVSPNTIESKNLAKPESWWSPQIGTQFVEGNGAEVTAKLTEKLQTSVRSQMLSDVPVGAFLSGGIDSSIVAAMMQENSSTPIDTFSLGFQEQRFDEAPFARAVAHHLGTNHTEMYLSDREAAQIAPKLSTIYSEPFADGSQIPTIAISQFARSDVTVVLTGDGGDELFGGYRRYIEAPEIWEKVSKVPLPGRNLLARIVATGSSKYPGRIKSKLISLARLASSLSESELYKTFVSIYEPTDILTPPIEPNHDLGSKWDRDSDLASKMMVTDMETYLVDDLLVKVDRAGMAFGLETRMPFLDINVANFALSLPVSRKIKDRETKWILRRVLDGYAPRQLFDRPKKGFSAPIEMWLRSPAFADWVGSNLASSQLLKSGFFNTELVERMLSDHLAGRRNWQAVLWNIAVFQDWFTTRRG